MTATSADARDRVDGEGPDRVRALPGGGWPGSIPSAPMGYLTAGTGLEYSNAAQAFVDRLAVLVGLFLSVLFVGAIAALIYVFLIYARAG